MSSLAILALSFLSSPAMAAQPAAYSCVAIGEANASACPASELRVAGGKGAVAVRGSQATKVAANADAVCHSDPAKGRACRHHNLQRATNAAPAGEAFGLREETH